MRIRAVVFDVDETLVSTGRRYAGWADRLGVPRHVLMALLGAAIARGEPEHSAAERLRPGYLGAARERRFAAGSPDTCTAEDLYFDARDCLAALAGQGVGLGIAGERPADAAPALGAIGIHVDLIAAAGEWRLERASPWYFARLVVEAGCRAGEILYVTSRAADDLRPAREAGLLTAFLRRGPWGYLQGDHSAEPRHCRFRLDSLVPLPGLVAEHNAGRHSSEGTGTWGRA